MVGTQQASNSEGFQKLPDGITPSKIQELKQKYSSEMKDHPDNPIKVCMKLIFEAAIEKDSTKRSSLSLSLSEFLTRPDGIINLFLALIDFDESSQKHTTHNQRFIAVANIITCLPNLCLPYEEYCQNITTQLKPLLISDNTRYSNLACIVIRSMLESPNAARMKKKITNIVLDPIFEPLLQKSDDSKGSTIKPHESVIAMHNLIQNHLPKSLFVKFFHHLFYALVTLRGTPSRLKSPLEFTLVTILNYLKPGAACCLLEKTLFYDQKLRGFYVLNEEDNEISIKISSDDDDGEMSSELKERLHSAIVDIMIDLLEGSDNDLFILEYFFHFKDILWTAKDSYKHLIAKLIEPLLDQTLEEVSSKLDLLSIIATNSERSLELISRTLMNYLTYLRCEPRGSSVFNELIDSSISGCLSILEVLIVTMNTRKSEETFQRKCLPVLKQIRDLLDHESSKNLLININSIIDRFEDNNHADPSKNDDHVDSKDQKADHALDAIVKDLNDSLVPVRVHALVQLKHMVMANDPHVLSRITHVFSMIQSCLKNEEPYVFLSCINLISEMAIRKTSELLPLLVELYSDQQSDPQVRVNTGEIFVKLIKKLNELSPFYAQQVMNMFFNGCKDPDELMRISNLTNMGEFCRHLGDSLGKYMVEILECVRGVLASDTIAVKCASVDLLRTTLSGLDPMKTESIQRELKSIYGLLKTLTRSTLDDKLCLQVDLALDEMDRLARGLVGLDVIKSESSSKLVKEIKFLSILDR